MPIFQPKHQKLILQCYPPGRGFDKKPNSSELSYLLYYASTRRVKLEKVGKFIEKKNTIDISRNRTGNVQVTLEIINSLIKKCPDDLNVFAQNVNVILSSVLTTKDLGLCQHAEPVFNTFCNTLDGELFTGDLEFVDNFTKLAESFLRLGSNPPSSNTTEWKAIALNASRDLAHCQNIAQGNGNYIVKKLIPFILSEIHEDFTKDQLQSEVKSNASQHELSRYNTARSTLGKHDTTTTSPIKPPQPVENGESTPKEIATDELALNSLKAFFGSSSSSQLVSCTKAICHYFATYKTDHEWASILVEMITTWVPVQLRFVILSVISSHLKKNGKPQEQLIYLHTISKLLSSSVNMVGLSILDNLRQLTDLQSQIIIESNNKDVHQLVFAYSEVISSLATHIYYQNQIVDTVGELLIRIKNYIDLPSSKTQFNAATLQTLVLVHLDNIKNVIITANNNSTVQRVKVPLDLFDETLELLSYNNKNLSNDSIFQIQSKYTDVLITLLKLEYLDSKDSELENHNSLISDSKASVINEVYEEFERISILDNYQNYNLLIEFMELIVKKFGINAIVNLLPFFFEWQLKNETGNDLSLIYKDNIGYLLVFYATQYLNDTSFQNEVISRIEYRKENNLWNFNINLPIESSKIKSSKLEFTKDETSNLIENHYGNNYNDLIFNSHYKYQTSDPLIEDGSNDSINEHSFISQNGAPQNFQFTLFPPTSVGENHSIRSAPLSARSLLNGRLQAPKVQELRKAISGTALKPSTQTINGGNISKQHTDLGSVLQDLNLSSTFDDRGSLAFR
ncbi:hypothetical protein BN7_564 [Wickerhamomyces ciferrii]|uniref:Protein EFR3 n=1 Tax=Wickerhamomyces ciferrii (strain ATCC 14091 / BCRC 22168 / CBS 111 / JCM 3599 / NBRC 0793 / NRRL Y-1031 F-60-10) TaxID=1206466 RepID=K0KFL6_WICCF|nr:uncharacterized protein BN7_564 [Wickerhamomyces ciferrii]CCH41027.1 hypothetical protein BN7_564 [Wickerhamomyces ciferrii]